MASAKQIAKELRKVARQVDSAPKDALKAEFGSLAKDVKKSIADSTGGDSRLSGLGNRPLLGATVKIQGSAIVEGTLRPSPKSAMGPHYWLEKGTNPHRIIRKQIISSPAKSTWSEPLKDADKDIIDRINQRLEQIIWGR